MRGTGVGWKTLVFLGILALLTYSSGWVSMVLA
jgi:hypothetical protein